jgi:DNA-binding MarR family transcriptional regulator
MSAKGIGKAMPFGKGSAALKKAPDMFESGDQPQEGSVKFTPPIGRLLHDTARLRRQVFDARSAPVGLTRSQYWVLAFIGRNAKETALTQTEIAAALQVGKVTLGATIYRLELRGFVRRKAAAHDRRVKYVSLTASGLKVLGIVHKMRPMVDELMMRGLSRVDSERVTRALSIMRDNLVEMLNAQ